MVGDTLCRYRTLARASQGRTATVYLAERLSDGGPVALKIVHPEIVADGSRLAAILDGARRLGQLRHPAIPRLLEIVDSEGHVALVTEWIEGESLADRLLIGPLGEDEAAR